MYTLREVVQDGVQRNFFLGKEYTLISLYETPDQFKRLFREFWNEEFLDICSTHAFVKAEDGKDYPISKTGSYYIMTSKGSTFANLSFNPI